MKVRLIYPDQLEIEWPDGRSRLFSSAELRAIADLGTGPISNAKSPSRGPRSLSAARWLLLATWIVVVLGTVAITASAKTVLISSPLLGLLSSVMLYFAIRTRYTIAIVMAGCHWSICLLFIALVNLLRWSAAEAQVPFLIMGSLYAVTTIFPTIIGFLHPPGTHVPGVCDRCGYLLYRLSEPRCPECSLAFDPAELNVEPPQEFNSSMTHTTSMPAIFLALIGVFVAFVGSARAQEPSTQPVIPTPNFASTQPYAWTQDASGWTTPPTPSRRFYIDGNNGSDSGPGTEEAPLKTTAPALKRLADGDALLFKRGSVNSGFTGWVQKSYVQILPYGTGPLPIIQSPPRSSAIHVRASNCLLFGLDIRGDGNTTKGVILEGSGHRLEGCSITNHNQATNFGKGVGVVVFRCNLSRNFKHDPAAKGYAQGAYADGAEGLTFDSCVFNYNGWDGVDPKSADVHQHGIYNHCGTPPQFATFYTRNCFVAENGSNGIMGRNPGVHEDDFFLDNGIHGWGLVAGGPESTVRKCVFTGALDAPARQTMRGLGLELDSLNGSATDNLFVNSRGPTGPGISINWVDYNHLAMKQGSLTIARNRIVNWQGIGIQFDKDRKRVELQANDVFVTAGNWTVNYRVPPAELALSDNAWGAEPVFRYTRQNFSRAQWQDLTRDQPAERAAQLEYPATVEAYAQSVGLEPNGEALIRRVEANGPDNWDPRFTAAAVNAFMRGEK